MAVHQVCIAELLQQAVVLETVSDTPRLDLEVLLCHVLNKPRSYLYTWPEKVLDESCVERFNSLLQRRSTGQPIAYLLGEKEFWSLPLEVSEATLIPRPETELLVETALKIISRPDAQVLDLGTGTGAIALALASEHPRWQITAVDVVLEAVALAERNRLRLGLENVSVVQSNWFENITAKKFDLIVTNPPYIADDDPHLNQGDVRFEPKSALVAKNKGLADISSIIVAAKEYLGKGAYLFIEHGYQQGQAVRYLFELESYTQIVTLQDLSGCERLSYACLA